MSALKPRKTWRGYVLAAVLAGTGVWIGMEELHLTPVVSVVVVAGGAVAVIAGLARRHRGISVETRRRR
jgi:hypothetical protein